MEISQILHPSAIVAYFTRGKIIGALMVVPHAALLRDTKNSLQFPKERLCMRTGPIYRLFYVP